MADEDERPRDQLALEVQRADHWCRYYAAQRGLSLEAFAAAAGVGRSSITQMRNRSPSLRTLSLIAEYLGVQVRDLLMDLPEQQR